jgi:hypothetical protein
MNPVPGWMTDADLQAIDRICAQVPLGAPVLEIGSFLGRSSIQWAARLPSSKIVCVDACLTRWCAQPHTIICGHDYNPNFHNSVYRQVNAFASTHAFEVVHHDASTVFELRKHS